MAQRSKVELVDGWITGTNVTDQVCLKTEANTENICIKDLTFTMASEIDYPKVTDIAMGGVIPFNQYDISSGQSLRLVYDLYLKGILKQKTL